MKMSEKLLDSLKLPDSLRQRVLSRVEPGAAVKDQDTSTDEGASYVLYLPTVVLRKRHNPGFAFACRLANHYQVPLIVLHTILDDDHLSERPLKGNVENPSICMTSRRLAFLVEALQSCCSEWEEHGAGVAIRIHGPGAKAPDHLTLAIRSLAVVTDEPFVEPYTTFVRKVVRACQSSKVPCWSVDGSTTVPPNAVLKLQRSDAEGNLYFNGAPAKAWIWEKNTKTQRKVHVHAATQLGHLDAPELEVALPSDFFRHASEGSHHDNRIVSVVPVRWLQGETIGLFSVSQLVAIVDPKAWATDLWHGADSSVPPCHQTHGSKEAALTRWNDFLNEGGLKQYARRRNQIAQPHAVSRISCYLNVGILSIFDVVHDVWEKKAAEKGYSDGTNKFLDEVVKWREIGYVWGFSSPIFKTEASIPTWARTYLHGKQRSGDSGNANDSVSEAPYLYKQLESGSTQDDKWNAMQNYLTETGELHNNARMTWGKTVVHWQASGYCPSEILWQLCCLNDRFALDGLSPPSYAGLLWCFGWGDKAGSGGAVTTKWASRYRSGPDGFRLAKQLLLGSPTNDVVTQHSPKKRPRISPEAKSPKKKTIRAYFSPVSSVG